MQRSGVALADAFHLGRMRPALALLLKADPPREIEQRAEAVLKRGIALDLAADIAGHAAEPGSKELESADRCHREKSRSAGLVRRVTISTLFGPSTEIYPLEAEHRADRDHSVEDDGGIALQLHRGEGREHHRVKGDGRQQDSARGADFLPTVAVHAPLNNHVHEQIEERPQ